MSTTEKKVAPILPGTPEFQKLPVEEQRARVARVLDRASQVDRLSVALPPGVYGEWITDTPIDRAEAQRKGFVIDNVYAPKHTIHESNRQGDVVFMTMPMELKQLYDEQQAVKYNEVHGKKQKDGTVKAQAEDIEFTKSETQIGLPTTDDSVASSVSGQQIQNALGGK